MAKHTARLVAVFARTRRIGRWKIAPQNQVVAVLGSCNLDLTQAILDQDTDDISISVISIFGSVTILLPPGSQVEPSGIAVLASGAFDLPPSPHQTELPPIDLRWLAVIGRIRVKELTVEEPPAVIVAPARHEEIEPVETLSA